MTDRHYEPGVRSCCYLINGHLILWLLGFRTCDLVWNWDEATMEARTTRSPSEVPTVPEVAA